MRRSFADARRWTQLGTALLAKEADLGDDALSVPSALPGWTRGHLLAHVAANADGLGNLIHWAATGEPTPMYSSPEERAAGIERGPRLPGRDLQAWLDRSASALEDAMTRLSDEQWQASVTTAQGRTVPASEVPWMRAREACVHAVDLGTGVHFGDLPADFLIALCDDVVAKRGTSPGPSLVLLGSDSGERWELSGSTSAVTLVGPQAEISAYLTGRPHSLVTAAGEEAPALPPWL
jgi:maleylpyruvate isomerase